MPKADVYNTFFDIPTPVNAPVRGGLGEFYRFKTKPICRRCGMQWTRPLILQFPKYDVVSGLMVMRQLPGIHDRDVMAEFMVRTCNTAVGCWRECRCGKNWNMTCRNNCVIRGLPNASGWGVARNGDCLCLCTCQPGCGNKKLYPCRCGWTSRFHAPGCPVALFKRDSSFLLPFARQKMVEAGRRRERMNAP